MSDLTDVQRDTLARLVGGATNQEIASAQHMSEDTVKSRMRVLFARYDVGTRHELALAALTTDLPYPPRPWTGKPLTDREVQVLQALADTDSLHAAAVVLGLHRNTVKSHLARIASKAEAHGRVTYLLVRAWRADLIHYKGARVIPRTPVTFTEHVVRGVSMVTCDVCGEVVTAELKHIAFRHPEVQP